MANLIIDLRHQAGLTPLHHEGKPHLRLVTESTDQHYAQGTMNPYRNFGYASGSPNGFKDLTFSGGTYDAIFGSSQLDTINEDIYFAEYGRQFFKATTYDDTSLSMEHDLGATGSPDFTDIEIYQKNGSRFLFATFRKSGGSDMLSYDLSSTFDQTYLSTTATGGFNLSESNHRMIVADNGFMYILDGNAVHKLDGTTNGGTNGTATSNLLVFPPYFTLTDAVDTRGRMFMVLNGTTTDLAQNQAQDGYALDTSGVYLWDRLSTAIAMRDFIPVKAVKEARYIVTGPNAEIILFTIGTNNLTQIREYTGTTFKVMEELPVGSFPSFRDSISVNKHGVEWLGADGKMYMYGKVNPAQARNGVYQFGDTSDDQSGTPNKSGAILYGRSNNITGYQADRNEAYFLSYEDASNNRYATRWYATKTGTVDSTTLNNNVGNVYSMVHPIPHNSFVKNITIQTVAITSNSGSTEDFTVKVYFNNSETAAYTFDVTRDDIQKGYKYKVIKQSGVHFVQIEIERETSVTLDVGLPIYADVEYEPSSKKQ